MQQQNVHKQKRSCCQRCSSAGLHWNWTNSIAKKSWRQKVPLAPSVFEQFPCERYEVSLRLTHYIPLTCHILWAALVNVLRFNIRLTWRMGNKGQNLVKESQNNGIHLGPLAFWRVFWAILLERDIMWVWDHWYITICLSSSPSINLTGLPFDQRKSVAEYY